MANTRLLRNVQEVDFFVDVSQMKEQTVTPTRELIEQRRDVWHELSLEGSENRRLDDMVFDLALAGLKEQEGPDQTPLTSTILNWELTAKGLEIQRDRLTAELEEARKDIRGERLNDIQNALADGLSIREAHLYAEIMRLRTIMVEVMARMPETIENDTVRERARAAIKGERP